MYGEWMDEIPIIISDEEVEEIEKTFCVKKIEDAKIWLAKKILGI